MSNSVALKFKTKASKKTAFFSKPLFKQSVKSNLMLWLIMTLGSAAIFVIINLVVGTKQIFTNIDMSQVQAYVADEGLQWLQILGLLERMGFNLSRIQTMSQIDLNSIMNDLVYKIAGVLLPMIYVMIVCNKLLASQVSDGSMAYVLSTPTARKKVVRTQYMFMIGSLIAMYLVITVCAYISGAIAYYVTKPEVIKPSTPTFATFSIRTVLYCLGSFIAMFGLTGICFGASALFNKANKSIAVGGGACVLAFLCCILGLFGNKVFVSVGVGVEAMNIFNYMTIYTLVDTEGMSNFAKFVTNVDGGVNTIDWIWKLGILVGIGGVLSFLGGFYFTKKDLPL
ncbi:MAG: ABC-2 transporter permease [Bacilli bacterium]|nr:ABC-2 transporter permease [Bacilli bacterium]